VGEGTIEDSIAERKEWQLILSVTSLAIRYLFKCESRGNLRKANKRKEYSVVNNLIRSLNNIREEIKYR
jgi:hypothetical protein